MHVYIQKVVVLNMTAQESDNEGHDDECSSSSRCTCLFAEAAYIVAGVVFLCYESKPGPKPPIKTLNP